MSKILLVEDSALIVRTLRKELEGNYFHKVLAASSFAEARKILDIEKDDIALAIVDFKLPDAGDGEAIDHVAALGIPVLALTGSHEVAVRDRVLAAGVVDYIAKGRPEAMNTIALEADRILRRKNGKVLVVDPREKSRVATREMLETARYKVVEATDGDQAMEVLSFNPDTKAVLIEAELPNGDGFGLAARIRSIYSWHTLPLIGVSTDFTMSAMFLKTGANDFLARPFLREELCIRLSHNIELAEQYLALRRALHTDYLTQLPNRAHFFNLAVKLYENSRRDNIGVTVAMLDIDRFRDINGRYGHKAGDAVLKHIAGIFKSGVRKSDIVCRFGGEEFCFMMTNVSEDWMIATFEKLRKFVESSPVRYLGKTIPVTVSIGVTSNLAVSLEAMVRRADEKLHEAKNAGRNRIMVDSLMPAAARRGK